MGQEAEGALRFRGAEGAGRILVESAEVILRGEIRARVPRAAVHGVRVEGDDLVLETAEGPLVATIGETRAAALQQALLKPPRSLAQKLGIDASVRAGCLWPVTDPVLQEALAGRVAPVVAAAVLVAEVLDSAALARLVDALPDLAARPVWCVNAKGRNPVLPEARIREAMRAAGWIDSKTTAVSDAVSATRYARRKG
ncbi:MAG: hypothetical protein HC844_21605 [Tabrizicola sp.]|nr:hypothetical protein [Tabrizicola sp.]